MTAEDEIIQLLDSIRYDDQLSKRLLFWMQVLEILVTQLDMTSAYICRHDFRRHETISICQYVSHQSGSDEAKSDPGERFFESEFPNTIIWLRSNDSQPRVLHASEMDADDPELQEYHQSEVKTALMAKLFASDNLWGYIELWDTQRKRNFGPQTLEAVKRVAMAISKTIP
jgi:hypothetical protein